MTDESVRAGVTLSAPASHAFAVFTERIGEWWPRPYTFSQDDLALIAIDSAAGGRWYEVDRSGRRLEWGEVRAFDPPRRLVLTWAVGADRKPEPPERASEVEIGFRAQGPQTTRVELAHRGFERHGQGAEILRRGLGSSEGWPLILKAFARAASPTARAALCA